jgi:sialate O-acetylesterase
MAAADAELSKKFKAANGYALSGFINDREAFIKEWKAKVEKAKAEGKRAPRGPARIGDLYARHIEYMVPYGIRGVLWDQGESKTQIPGVADQYVVMNALITGWRKVWGQGDFHFLHVQKPSGGVCPWDPENPVNRGAKAFSPNLPSNHFDNPNSLAYHLDHVRMGTLKNAPLVTALDLGTGVHPSNKSGYGKRACRVALGSVYGRELATSGPVYKSHKVEGKKIRVFFDHVGKGLAFRHAKVLQGFEIAGEDGKWQWAEAAIDGGSVVLSHPEVSKPLNIQYAFSNKPSYANFFNKDGLPGLTFTTVKWER